MRQIEQDIAALEQAVQAIAQEFRSTYTDYLTALGQAVRQQLVLASYRLCTQGYPDRFLRLSFQQRQELQQALRQLGQQAQVRLMVPLQETTQAAEAQILSEEISPKADELQLLDQDSMTLDDSEQEVPDSQSLDQDVLNQEILGTDEVEPESELDFSESTPELRFDQPMNPVLLARWQEALEQNIGDVLRSTSHAANRLLQQADILPNKLPEPILEVAAKSGMMAEAASATPNLLNLLVETEEQEESKVTHIVAIRLRLFEIEFGDGALATGRSKIRSLSARLNQLGRDYQKKQRERSIAEAESAWRSSWYE